MKVSLSIFVFWTTRKLNCIASLPIFCVCWCTCFFYSLFFLSKFCSSLTISQSRARKTTQTRERMSRLDTATPQEADELVIDAVPVTFESVHESALEAKERTRGHLRNALVGKLERAGIDAKDGRFRRKSIADGARSVFRRQRSSGSRRPPFPVRRR